MLLLTGLTSKAKDLGRGSGVGKGGRQAIEQQFELWWGNFNELLVPAAKAPVDSFLFQHGEKTTFLFSSGAKS